MSSQKPQTKPTTTKAVESHKNTPNSAVKDKVEELVKKDTNEQIKGNYEPKTSQIDKGKAVEIIMSARTRVSRVAQTSISMPCREVFAMLNGIKDSIEKL